MKIHKHSLLFYVNNTQLAKLLIEEGFDANDQSNDGRIPLINACKNSSELGVINLLISNGADVNLATNTNFTPLMVCACHYTIPLHFLQVARLLIKHGANIYSKDNSQMTAFMSACLYGFVEMMEVTFTGQEHINDVDHLMRSPLMFAIVSNNIDAVKWLVEHRADVTMADKKGKTVLEYAELDAKIKDYIEKGLQEKRIIATKT